MRDFGLLSGDVTGFEIRKMRRLPFAPFDVYGHIYCGPPEWQVEHGSCQRFAGGFWTRRGAQQWIDREKKVMRILGLNKKDW